MWCKWCDEKGDEPTLLDIHGVRREVTDNIDVCWGHAREDNWWPCQRKACEEHAEILSLEETVERLMDAESRQDAEIERLRAAAGESEMCGGLVDSVLESNTRLKARLEVAEGAIAEQAKQIERLQRLIGDAAARMRSDYCCSLDSDTPAQRMAFIECLEATEAKEKSDELTGKTA